MNHTQDELAGSPFSSQTPEQLFYAGLGQREALARLRFLSQQGRCLGLVLGLHGMGKSLLLEVFGRACRQQGDTVVQLDLLALSTRAFFGQLTSALQTPARAADDAWRLFQQVTDRFYEDRLQGKRTVLLLDNADHAETDLQIQLARLAQLEAAGKVTMVLTANPQGGGQLSESLREMIELHAALPAWDELDTIGYLQSVLLESAGPVPQWSAPAQSLLHQLAEGVPRKIKRLAEYALWLGGQESAPCIGPETVQAAQQAVLPQWPQAA